MGQKTDRLIKRIELMMEKYKELEYFGGIGKAVGRLRELPQSFSDADYAFSGRFLSRVNQIIRQAILRICRDPKILRSGNSGGSSGRGNLWKSS